MQGLTRIVDRTVQSALRLSPDVQTHGIMTAQILLAASGRTTGNVLVTGLKLLGSLRGVVLRRLYLATRRTGRWLFLLASIPCLATADLAPAVQTVQLPLVDGKDIRFRRMSMDGGLSQTRVGQIVQDNRGFIWFGTAYGLNRFDGSRFKVFVHDRERPDSLGGVQITALFVDHAGTLWIGSNHLLDRYDPTTETFTHFRMESLPSDNSAVSIFNISEDSDHKLWLSTRRGLYRFDPATEGVTRYAHRQEDAESITSNEVISTGQDRAGVFWIGHRKGIEAMDRVTGKIVRRVPLEDRSRLLFHEDRYGTFWLIYGPDNTLATLDRQNGTITRYPIECEVPLDTKLDSVMGMFEDRDGVMWFATRRSGLVKFDRSQRQFVRYRHNPDDATSVAADRITTIFQDREGNFWIGLDEAPPNFFLSRPPLFENLTSVAGKPGGPARRTVVYKDSEGTFWLGSEKALWKLQSGPAQHPEEVPMLGAVVSIAEQTPGLLWMAGNVRGLVRVDQKTGAVGVYRPDSSNPHALNTVQIERIVIAHNGTPWLATWDGLAKLDPATDQFTIYRNKAGSGYHTVVEDSSGILWLGSEQGLQEFDPRSEQFATYGSDDKNPQSISDNRVANVFIDHSGTLWAGTQNGLNRFDKQTHTFTSYFERDGLAGNVVSCIMEDSQHFLWMSTNHGVSRLDPDRRTFSNYGVADGLPGLDLTGWGTCSKSSDGEMFFSGYSGAVGFYPERATTGGPAPQVSLTGFRLFGDEVSMDAGSPLKQSIITSSAIKLAHWQNFFSLEFAALSYYSPSTTRYRYMLDGVDPHWIEVAGNQQAASYTSIAPGVYTFHLQGRTGRGPWSEPGIAIQVEVMPPWWSTLWFRLFSVVAGSLAAIWFYQRRVSQITTELNVRFEERLAERTRIARELHDTLLQSFHGLLYKFQAARNLLSNRPEEAVQLLDGAIVRAEEALVEGRDAIHDLRSDSPARNDIARLILAMGEDLASLRSTETEAPAFRVIVEGENRPLSPAVYDELGRIAHELLRNAFQHAEAREIEAEVRYEDRMLRLCIRDDGRGIDPAVLQQGSRAGHWGLPGVRERAKQIGAKLELSSHKGAGTEVELKVPAQAAYVRLPDRPRSLLSQLLNREENS